MYYKVLKYYVVALILIIFFVLGFLINIRYIKHQLKEYEGIYKSMYAHLLSDILFEEYHTYQDEIMIPEKRIEFYKQIDIIIQENISHILPTNKISYIFTNEKDSVLHSYNEKKNKHSFSLFSQPDYFQVASISLSDNSQINISIPDLGRQQNKTLLTAFTGLWILLCLVTFGLILYFWQKQKKMQKIRMDVINNMSHEFKTPLTSIQLISEMMMQQGSYLKEEKLKQYAGIIHQESDKMLQQANQLLNTAYYNTRYVLRKRKHNVHGLIEYFVTSYSTVFGDNEIIISRNFNAENPVVSLDRTHFVNVLTNLLDNARKYSGHSLAEVAISTYNDHDKLFIEISDNGTGIDSKYHKLIFDRFYRVPQGNVHEKSGYGVGLYYVKNILAKMNAKIRVKSRSGNGTTFTIQFKISKKRTHKTE
jgi:signal transduction histidine kinase